MLNFDFYEKYPTWKCSSLSLLTSHLSRGYNTINTQAKKGFFFRFVEILPKTEAKLTMIFPLSSIIERNYCGRRLSRYCQRRRLCLPQDSLSYHVRIKKSKPAAQTAEPQYPQKKETKALTLQLHPAIFLADRRF